MDDYVLELLKYHTSSIYSRTYPANKESQAPEGPKKRQGHCPCLFGKNGF
jgi:hypothetical protein